MSGEEKTPTKSKIWFPPSVVWEWYHQREVHQFNEKNHLSTRCRFFFSFGGACCVILSWLLSKFVARLLTRVKELRSIKPRLVWINNEPSPCLSVPTALVFVWSSFQINYSPKNIIIQKNKRFIQWKDCVKQRARMLKLNASRYNGAFFPQNLSFSVNSTDTTSQHKYHFRKISVKRHERYPTRNVQSEPCVSFMSASRHLVRSRYLATYL